MKKILLAVLLIAAVNVLHGSALTDLNYSLHQTRKELRKQSPEYRQCDDDNWPATKTCDVMARVGVKAMRNMDLKFGGE